MRIKTRKYPRRSAKIKKELMRLIFVLGLINVTIKIFIMKNLLLFYLNLCHGIFIKIITKCCG